jgi:NADPH:quinone reductase-like Zn-dependent oxidoreductase
MFESSFLGPMLTEKGGRKMGGVTARRSQKDLVVLKELVETGKLTSVIDKQYPLGETAEALRYLGTGHARGKVVIVVGGETKS